MGQITKNVRSRDQFKKYETETRSLRDQDRDRQQKAETETLKIGLETGLETKTGLETFITGIPLFSVGLLVGKRPFQDGAMLG